MANTLIRQDYLSALGDPELALAALTALAEEYGREPAAQADIDAWCEHIIVGEPEGLERIVPEERVDI